MLSEAEIRLIVGIIAALEAGIFGQILYALIYELATSKNPDTLGGF